MRTRTMKRTRRFGLFLGAVSAVCLGPSLFPVARQTESGPAAQAEIRFNRDIRPTLSNRCFKCHGPDFKKGGLDLQNRAIAVKPLRSGEVAIVPGKSADSALIERVS